MTFPGGQSVTVGSVISVCVTFDNWLLSTYLFKGSGIPGPVEAMLTLVVSVVVGYLILLLALLARRLQSPPKGKP